MTPIEWTRLLARHGSVLKARRALIRGRRWSEADWYANWPIVGAALEAALLSR
jgi:hypothetical protein